MALPHRLISDVECFWGGTLLFMLRRTASATLILLVLLPLANAQQAHVSGEALQPILQLIDAPGLSASLQLQGHCDPTSLPSFPNFRTTSNKTGSILQTIRNVVSPDRGIRVSQDEDGTIRMKEKGVPEDILNVQISHVSFNSFGRRGIYFASAAVQIIMSTPEVVAFLNEHDIHSGGNGSFFTGGIGWGSPPLGRPHIIAPLENVTVAEAFNRVLDSFRGEILVYWNCPADRGDTHARPAKTAEVWNNQAELFSNCSANSTHAAYSDSLPSLPNPFCLPLRAFQGLPLPPIPLYETSHQRHVYFRFFSLRKIGERMLVAGG
jgi:hypothetical protein